MSLWPRLLLLLALPVAAVACGDGDDDIARDLTVDDLAALVLSKEELGEKFAELTHFAEESGPQPNAAFLMDFEDADEGRRFIDDFGRVTGYDQVFQGPALVAQSLTLYGTSGGAAEAMAVLLDETEQVPGIELKEFDAGAIGDESKAVVMSQAGAALSTMVLFRIDTVGGLLAVTVSEASPLADEVALKSDARDLARKLADKIEAALES